MKAKQFVLLWTLPSIAWAIISPPVANAVLVVISNEPASANLPGYTKWTFEIDPEGDTLTLWEATFTSDTMSQFYPDDGVMTFPTVFQNNNIRFSAPDQVAGPFTPADDSQFDSLSTVDTFFPTESSGPLDPVNPMPLGTLSAIKGTLSLTTQFSLAHINIPTSSVLSYAIVTSFDGNETLFAGTVSVPEASQVLVGIAATISLLGIYTCRRLLPSVCR